MTFFSNKKIQEFKVFSSKLRKVSEEKDSKKEETKQEDKKDQETQTSIEFGKIYDLEKPGVNPGNPSAGVEVLSKLNQELEKKFEKEIEGIAKKIKDQTKDSEGEKPDSEIEKGMTPFGDVKSLVKSVAAWASNYSSSSDEYSFWKDEEELAQEDAALNTATQNFLGISLDPDTSAPFKTEIPDDDPELSDLLAEMPVAGFNRANQKEFADSTLRRLKSNPNLEKFGKSLESNLSKYGLPKFEDAGVKKYANSPEFDQLRSDLGLESGETDKIIKKLIKAGVKLGKDDKIPSGSFLVCLRSPRKIKNLYPNSFTDMFFLFSRGKDDKLNVKPMLGSTTPAPAFRYGKWIDIFTSTLGFRGLMYQGGSFIASPSSYRMTIDSETEKSKYYGTPILSTKKEITTFGNFKFADDARSAANIPTYSPTRFIDHGVMLNVCPSLIGGGSSEYLDGSTSGDLVVQNYEDFQSIIDAAQKNGGKIIVRIAEDPGDNESIKESKNLKYIRRI